jgi:hypothetical protein
MAKQSHPTSKNIAVDSKHNMRLERYKSPSTFTPPGNSSDTCGMPFDQHNAKLKEKACIHSMSFSLLGSRNVLWKWARRLGSALSGWALVFVLAFGLVTMIDALRVPGSG